MLPNLDALWILVDHLFVEAEYVTFYDALALVRAARSITSLPDGLLADWIVLHDAAHVTDGARAVFGQYLRRYRRRLEQQRSLATQVVVLKDSGKSLRATIGQLLAVSLDARPQQGWLWVFEGGMDGVRCEAMPVHKAPQDSEFKQRYVLTPTAQGSGVCRWRETRTAAAEPQDGMPTRRTVKARRLAPDGRRTFELCIIVEGG